jgi:hypothetical protein
MKRLIGITISAIALLVFVPQIHAQDLLVPAGTLLQCTLDEPNLSSATAAVGDPVLCHLRTMQEFGKPMFPRGSMLAGHIEAEKEPGHFVGKGYMKLTFDRIILPGGDLPVLAKVMQARGFKVDKQGDIDGKGHAKRDVAEWMVPPLWPWKVISLPFRGPRPTLKGEEPLEMRLMDDIVISHSIAYVHPDRPPYAADASPSYRPSSYNVAPQTPQTNAQPAIQLVSQRTAANRNLAPGTPQAVVSQTTVAQTTITQSVPRTTVLPSSERFTMLVLKSNLAYEVTKYRRDGDSIAFQDVQGEQGSVDVKDVDWRRTAEMTAQVRSVDAPIGSRQLN